MKAAGAIILGKTNSPELTLSFETDNPVYGRTNNPYDLDRTPGGSSGGSAAIVAAGGSPFDIGSDSAGSIRLPAHFCGIAGIRPTSGRVPRTGHAMPFGGVLDSLLQVGPIARYVEDLALILPIIAGVDGRDPAIVPVPLADPDWVELKGLRLAFHTDNGIQTPIQEIIATVLATAKTFSEAGVVVEEELPPDIAATYDLFVTGSLRSDGGAWVRLLLERAGTDLNKTSLKHFLTNPSLPPDEFARLIARWDRFRVRMLSFFDKYDLILSPVNAYPALPHGTARNERAAFSYTMTYNLTGWPAVVVRAGTSTEGLPIGVQIIARPWREEMALAAAAYIEQMLGGWQPPAS